MNLLIVACFCIKICFAKREDIDKKLSECALKIIRFFPGHNVNFYYDASSNIRRDRFIDYANNSYQIQELEEYNHNLYSCAINIPQIDLVVTGRRTSTYTNYKSICLVVNAGWKYISPVKACGKYNNKKLLYLDWTDNIYKVERKTSDKTFLASCKGLDFAKIRKSFDIIDNFNGQPVTFFHTDASKMFTDENNGIDMVILKEVAKILNATLRRSKMFANIYMGYHFYSDFYEIVYPYYYKNVIHWYTAPLAKRLTNSLGFIFAFNGKLWIFIFATFLAHLSVYLFVRKRARANNDTSLIFLEIFGSFFMQTIKIPNHKMVRYFLFLWIFFSFVIISAYNSKFFTLLIQPVYEKQINTVEELDEANYVAQYTSIMTQKFTKSRLYKHDLNVIKNMIIYKNSSLIATYETLDEIEKDVKKEGFAGFHKFIDNQFVLIGMGVEKGHPILQGLNKYVRIFSEVGLMNKWINDAIRIPPIVQNKPEPLTLDHFLLIFDIFCFGTTLATLIFVWEYCKDKSFKLF